jgi:hypothetical protein
LINPERLSYKHSKNVTGGSIFGPKDYPNIFEVFPKTLPPLEKGD